jgi:hypothetical protein
MSRKTAERVVDLLFDLGGQQLRLGIGLALVAVLGKDRRQELPTSLFSLVRPHAIRRDPVKIREQLTLLAIPGSRLIQSQKSLLGVLFSAVPIAGQTSEIVHKHILVTVNQTRESVPVTLLDPGNELCVSRAFHHHSPLFDLNNAPDPLWFPKEAIYS